LLDSAALLVSYNRDHKTHAILEVEDDQSDLYEWALDEYTTQREGVVCSGAQSAPNVTNERRG
jgi:hypothetical protein